jgi:hypothetical protein
MADQTSASGDPADEVGNLLPRLRGLLLRRRHLLNRIEQGLFYMSQEIDDLVATVTEERTVSDSVQALLEKIFAMITDVAGDKVKVLAVIADLRANIEKEKAAVVANTPVPPPPPGGAAPQGQRRP